MNDCTECHPNGTNDSGTCDADPGFFIHPTNDEPINKPCDDNCKTCVDTAVKCLTCHGELEVATDDTCKCKTGTYLKEGSTTECLACDDKCATCENGTECILCKGEETTGANC